MVMGARCPRACGSRIRLSIPSRRQPIVPARAADLTEISQHVRFVVGTMGGLPDTASSMLPIAIRLEDAMRSTPLPRHILAAAVPAIFGVCSPSAGFATPLPYSIDFSVTHVQTSSESGAIHRPLTPHPPTSLPGCSRPGDENRPVGCPSFPTINGGVTQ